ncbi:hypothetical protein COUCH_19955 [Couchioplanes caeruleus]|uniref:hypothetical protein n=1 Tax=Couchioplanes caeruleus TaxID=56438 RepID=UPI0020BF6DE8|nr:hypothetical protein [Couchioplanes caeruleus]UQU61339.1 hypothetical protein COUCH_19955 [Couchioplanes caeruleus]
MTPIDDTAVLVPVQEPADGLAAEIARAAPRRWWNRGTVGLGVAALLLAGFLSGLQAQKHWGTSATPATARPGGAQAGRGTFGSFPQGPAGAAAPTASAASGPTTGKVKLVDGTTIYVETAGGAVVTVRTGGDTAVRTATAGKLKDVRAGDTVSVQGAAGADGTVTATTVTKDKG